MKSTFTDPRGRQTDYAYDNRNRLHLAIEPKRTDQTNRPTTETLYDYVGNKTQVIFPDFATQRWNGYDAFGQPGQFTDERGNLTDMTYQWGSMKKLQSVTTHRAKDGGGTEDQLTTFSYDGMGRPLQTFFPDTTTEVNTYEFGQPKTWKTRRGQTKTITYDARGREQSSSWNDGITPGVTRTWDDANRLTGLSNVFSILDYSYDAAGQMLSEGNRVTGSTGNATSTRAVLSYCHYPSGEVSDITYPSGLLVHRTYTARGQLQGETWTGGSVNYVYFKDGKVDYEDYGNGVRSDLDYDGRGFISLTNTYRRAPEQVYSKRDYWRDDRDRITAWKKSETGRGDRYGYDAEGQLTSAVYDALTPEGTPSSPARTDSFAYDALGNRMGWNWLASRGQMWLQRRDNGLNQYLSWSDPLPNSDPHHWGSAIYHDDNLGTPPAPPWNGPGNGVTMADGLITTSYNALNQPMAIYSPALPSGLFLWLGYDPLGRCVKRWLASDSGGAATSNPATYFYYDGWNLIQEGVNANAPGRVYVHGGRVDEIVASCVWSGNHWAYHHYDARGHCILLTLPNGNIQEKYEYDAFGQPYFYNANGNPQPKVNGRPVSAWGNRFLFTGREWLGEVGLYDYRNRMYQPELGRFMQPDPKEFAAGDYNLYRYCHNDPINKSDPMGWTDWGQVGTGFLSLGGGLLSAGGAVAASSTGVGVVVAPALAASAGIGISVGLGNIIAGFRDDRSNPATQAIKQFPTNLGGTAGRTFGYAMGDQDNGEQAQNVGSLAENLLNIGGGFSGMVKAETEAGAYVKLTETVIGGQEAAIDFVDLKTQDAAQGSTRLPGKDDK